jgi:hypothetical protein
MVRILVQNSFDYNKDYIEAAGLSTDSKPTGNFVTGSMFLAVDTAEVYYYDEVGNTWHKVGGE